MQAAHDRACRWPLAQAGRQTGCPLAGHTRETPMAQDEIDDRYRPDPEPGDDDLWPAPPETDAEAARWKSGPDAGYPHDPGMNMACEYGDCDHREAPHI